MTTYPTLTFIHSPVPELKDDRLEPNLCLLYLATVVSNSGYPATIVDLSSVDEENWTQRIPESDI